MTPVEIARSWIDTPYRHQHSTKGVGCDCLGLIRGVYREIHDDEPEVMPNYSPSWGEVEGRELMLEAAARHLTPIPITDRQPGDVLIFRMRRGMIAKHCGVMVTGDRMVHAYQGVDRVVECNLVPYWTSRIVGVFRFPE
jgi:NlpC/P60 family putative phage cell wall peptidase